MFRNYLKTAFRNLTRYKGFAIINISSLTIGVLGCLMIGLFVWDEWQFDKEIPGGDQVYRIYEERRENSGVSLGAPVPPAYASFLKRQYPEVDATARILMTGDKFLMELGDSKHYENRGWFVDSGFFRVFPLPFIHGNPTTALNEPNTVVINEELAKRYFGNADPINKIISIDKDTFTVKGVLADLPKHFHLDFRYLMSLPSAGIPEERMDSWTWHQFYTYVKLKPGTHILPLQKKFQSHVKKDIYPTLTHTGSSFLPYFQPLSDIHLRSADFVYDNAIRGNHSYVNALSIIALFVLLIACFNFVNLSTARSLRRAREIGVRKVIGAERKQLIIQFISETVMLSVIAVILAAMAAILLVPLLNDFTGKSIHFNPLTNPILGLILLGSGVVVGILAGIYPALVLSGFQPIQVLKGLKLNRNGSTPWLRQALVALQFALSALLIFSSIIVYRQTSYMNQKDLGFNKEQIVFFQLRGDLSSNLESFKSELKNSGAVMSVTSGYGLPGDQFAGDGINVLTSEGEKKFSANVFIGDHDFIKTLGLRIVAGRDFSKEMSTDLTSAFIINETAVKELGFGTPENAIGRPMSWDEWQPIDTLQPVKKGRVIGVVRDFHYKSMHEKITTSVIHLYPQVSFKVAVKLRSTEMQAGIAHINKVWNQFSPGYPIDYRFMDESYGAMYQSEEKLSSLLLIFTCLAILVGCMGLFGLSAFSAEQRIKEIGIRKVLGAGSMHIVGLLSKNFILLILVASLIAFPVAWWAMNNWLADFPYRVSISWWIFALTAAAALVITFLTVSFQAIKAAMTNPVKSLRTE